MQFHLIAMGMRYLSLSIKRVLRAIPVIHRVFIAHYQRYLQVVQNED
jgi:hypothetical protein